jgi:hypothetical protein
MELTLVKKALQETPKGANIILEWNRPVEVKKAFQGANITKQVRVVGRIGVDYDNLKAVQEKRETGELPSENAGTWYDHDHEIKGLVHHKTTRAPYVQIMAGTCKSVKPSTTFLIDGKPVEKEIIAHMLTAKELKDSHGSDTIVCKIENLQKIHKVVETVEDQILA